MSESGLNRDSQRLLLRVARDTIEAFLTEGQPPRLDVCGLLDPAAVHPVKFECGAFVTIHRLDVLRGCIGYLDGKGPLWEMVADLTVSAASRDSRFSPVELIELPEVRIEISVLSRLSLVSDLEHVVIGRDGLVLQASSSRGVLLPQVAVQHGWDRDELLAQVCRKAGLRNDFWPGDGELYRFGADVFNERELGLGGGLDSLGRLPPVGP